ncbi:hypothetical protein BGZ65_008065 [Modicella reniformis]|uniref:Tail specific protease domain-containing protein n=1 Tax=Modicella reniformis TaxID=1440133 RepID=A0A9P6LTR6_9FUNG|nr:hypothetical protein BGZ65_008065 [Modicella reniformis]
MKITSILSLAVALCVVSVNAAPVVDSKITVLKPTLATTIAKAKPTATKPKSETKAKSKATKTTTVAASKPTSTPTTTGTKAATTVKPPKTTTPAATPTQPAKPKDPCSELAAQGKNIDSILQFNTVRDCYRAQSFKKDIADKTLTSVENLLGNFYIFLDQAKEATSAPFKTPKVDLMAGLKKIRETKWKDDYDFNMALTYLTFSANDGHMAYRTTFGQPISLYAPVVNGVQNIRVFYADDTQKGVPKDSIIDCVVNTIDGVPALKAVQDFTDRTSAISKDPGVRLNDALASISWYNDWLIAPGGFSKRWECSSGAPRKLTVPWIVKPSENFLFNTFRDTATYWNVQCLAPLSPYDNSRQKNDSGRRYKENNEVGFRTNEAPGTTLFRERGFIQMPNGGKNGRNDAPQTISKATEVLITATTAFYKINKSDACVAVIASEEAANPRFDPSDYLQFIQGLEKLRDGGCKKLILDMTNNGGGAIDFAYFINLLLFPTAKPYFVEDLRSNAYIQGAAKAAIKQPSAVTVFDARGYVSLATNKVFKDDSMFTKGVSIKRGGTAQTYSQKNYFEYSWSFMPQAKNNTLPWKASDIAIVTNGFCGSACTMIATRFNIVHKVKTYAIGGIYKTPLSYFTFPGGFVMDNESIVADVKKLNYNAKNGPSKLVVRSSAKIAVGEIYATENSTIPLEYDTKYFTANVHLDQDLVSARNPDSIWLKIAADFKK